MSTGLAVGSGSILFAQESDSDTDGGVVVDEVETLPSLPLVEVPVGCEPWQVADIVFVGVVVARDA